MKEIPKALKNAVSEERCVLFLGAGASKDATDANGHALPLWNQLLVELLAIQQDTANPNSASVLKEIRELLASGDLMSVTEWLDTNLGSHEFHQHLIGRLSTAQHSDVHEILSGKPFRAVMTTNYDRLIEEHWSKAGRNPFVVIPQDSSSITTAGMALNNPSNLTPVIKAHGSLNNPDSLIFFPRSYRSIMYKNEPFRAFMADVFKRFTFLFVGTSFRDPNFQSLLQWIYTQQAGRSASHFAILDQRGPVFQNYMKKNFNIDLITYENRSKTHAELKHLLSAL